jgi:hypothetical protein
MAFNSPFRKKPESPTQLVDVDVERIDGVDRPAHGRAFALYKSETGPSGTDADQIVAAVKRLMPSYDATIKGLISQAVDSNVLKMVDAQNKFKCFAIKSGEKMLTFDTLDQAVKFIEKCVMDAIAKGRRVQAATPLAEPQPRAMLPNGAALDDPSHNADPRLHLQMKPSSWLNRHKHTGPMIDGTRQPEVKRKRGALIDGRRTGE